MPRRTAVTTSEVAVAAVVLIAIGVGLFAVLRSDPWGERQSAPPDDGIDPALVRFEQTGEIPVEMRQVRGLAVGPDDSIYVAGDKSIHLFDRGGAKRSEITLDGEPKCLAVGGAGHPFPGRIYAAMDDHVEVVDPEKGHVATWKSPGDDASFTSIAVAGQGVFVADAGSRFVWRYDTSGNPIGRIGEPDEEAGYPGFIITSPYFDLAVDRDGRLRVVNPRAKRIETHTGDGELKGYWGESSEEVEGFCGCCNPAHFAMFSDGRFVTAEKGKPRIKVYGPRGKFESVVAGPKQVSGTAADVAVDGRGRVLVLDSKSGSVRIFEHKRDDSGAEK